MDSLHYTKISVCRICQSEALHPVVSLGKQRLVDFVSSPESRLAKPVVPLEVVICANCKLVQLYHTTDPEMLFSEFWYRSSINEQMRSALLDVVTKSYEKAKLGPGDAVCDIGCNDGTMLDMYPKHTITVGFDPSNQLANIDSKEKMSFSVNNYFNREDALKITTKIGKRFKVITAIAMFYDIPDPAEFLNDMKLVLDDNGIIVIQMNYLLSMIKNFAFDNICHEHLTYYSLTSMRWVLRRCGLEVVDVETNEINGGSFRVYLKKTPIKSTETLKGGYERIKNQLELEKEAKLDQVETYTRFGRQVLIMTSAISKYIVDLVSNGKIVYGYGASTRGTVLLNSTPVPLPLAGVAERDQNKVGKYMTSGWLKIVTEEYARSRCKFMLVLPWHFAESIIVREQGWLQDGGTLIFPLGGKNHGPHLVDKFGEKFLTQEKQDASLDTTVAKS